jgi:predicted  nucleic acid-binding Zn-ribbon protein
MTLAELEEIKKDIESGLTYTDIAMNRALSKAPMIAILNFEDLLSKKYQNLYDESLGSEIIKLQSRYEDEIKSLNSKIKNLKSFNKSNEINNLKDLEENLKDEISFLKRSNINLEREISKYKNSFFSFLIK